MTSKDIHIIETFAKSIGEELEVIAQNIIEEHYEKPIEVKYRRLFAPDYTAALYFMYDIERFSPFDCYDDWEMRDVSKEDFISCFGEAFDKESEQWKMLMQEIYNACDEVKDEYGYLSEE